MRTGERPRSIVAVMAHPDDAELWARRHARRSIAAAGAAVAVVVRPPPATRCATRRPPSSAGILGADLHQPADLTGAWLSDLLIDLASPSRGDAPAA